MAELEIGTGPILDSPILKSASDSSSGRPVVDQREWPSPTLPSHKVLRTLTL
jgi:hypothetical protein